MKIGEVPKWTTLNAALQGRKFSAGTKPPCDPHEKVVMWIKDQTITADVL